MLHQSLSSEVKSELTQAFCQFDKDGDGRITADELGSVLRALGVETTEAEVAQMMREADLDGNGSVDLDEFLAINARAEQMLAGQTEKEVSSPFLVLCWAYCFAGYAVLFLFLACVVGSYAFVAACSLLSSTLAQSPSFMCSPSHVTVTASSSSLPSV